MTATPATPVPLTSWKHVAALPVSTDGPGYDRRRINTEFITGSRPVNDDHYGEGVVEAVVYLSTNHFGKAEYAGRPDRVYLSTLGYFKRTRYTDGGTVSEGTLHEQVSALVQRADAPRYSTKALTNVHEAALAHLASDYATNPRFQQVFAEAVERHLLARDTEN